MLGPITGIVFFVIEKDPFVRFHAMQSTVVFVTLFILQSVLGFTLILLPLVPLISIVGFVLCVVCFLYFCSSVYFTINPPEFINPFEGGADYLDYVNF